MGACPNTNQRPHTMCKGIGGGVSQHKSNSPHHVQRDWWGLVPKQINVPTPCAKGLVGACPNTNQTPHTMCKAIGGGGVPTQINIPTPCAKGLVGACPKTNQTPHTMCKGIGGGLSQNKSTSPHHVQRDWWRLVPTQIKLPTPCAKGLVGACPNTNQHPHTMCKAIGGGVSQNKSTSPHHVQRDWWGLVPTQINVPTPCAKGSVGACPHTMCKGIGGGGCPNTNQRPHTMCKGIGGGLSQNKSTSPHHVQRDWWGLVPTQIKLPTPCAKGLVGACPNTNQTPRTMCKGIGGGLPQHKSTSPHHVQRDWWGLSPKQIKLPTPCVKGLVGACPKTNQRPHTMCKGSGGGLSQHKSTSPHHVQRDWWGGVPKQINVPTPCAKGLVGGCPKTNQHPHTMCKGIGGGLSQNKSNSPHHVQRDWWGLVPKQINVPTPCAKGLVEACPNTNQTPHTMCKGIGGGVSQHKSTSPHHVQSDWWGGVPKQINVPTPCAKGLVGACPNTNQRPHTMCKGIGGGVSPHHVQRDWWGGVSQHKSTSPHHV